MRTELLIGAALGASLLIANGNAAEPTKAGDYVLQADQVTYDLHIILRFEIELKLMERQLAVADVPAYWNEHFEKSFGLKVAKDADGCLQDIHWSLGSMGYFPTYTLGNLNAAQLMRQVQKDCPALETELAIIGRETAVGVNTQERHAAAAEKSHRAQADQTKRSRFRNRRGRSGAYTTNRQAAG